MTHPDKWYYPKTTKKYKCPICGYNELEVWGFRDCDDDTPYEKLNYIPIYHCPNGHSMKEGGTFFTKDELI